MHNKSSYISKYINCQVVEGLDNVDKDNYVTKIVVSKKKLHLIVKMEIERLKE